MDKILNNKIDKYFEIEDEANRNILDQLTLYIYFLESQKSQSDLYLLARLLEKDPLYKIIDYYDGDTLYMPSKEEYKRAYMLGISFFLKKIVGLNWEQIKGFLNLSSEDEESISSISLGRRINQIEEEMLGSIGKTLKKIKVKDFKQLLEDMEKNE